MSKQDDLVKLDRRIKEIENRIKTFTTNMDAVKKELDFLGTVEEQLESNIKYLKKVKTIALASEYKKAKEDLKKTKIRLAQRKGDWTINERAYKELEVLLKKDKEAYDKLSQQDDNNVFQGKFGKRNA